MRTMSAEDDEIGGESGAFRMPPALTDPIGVVRRRWRSVAIATGIGVGLLIGLLLVWPDQYLAASQLLVSGTTVSEEFVRKTLTSSADEEMNGILAEVLSRESIAPIVERYVVDRWPTPATVDQLVGEVQARTTVTTQGNLGGKRARTNSYVFDIAFQAPDPDMAADVANALVESFTEVHMAQRTHQARLTTEFLTREMERAEEALRQQSALLRDFKVKNRGQLPTELSTKLSRIDRLQSQRQSLALQISDAESRLITLQSTSLDSDARARILADLQDRLAKERVVNTDEHPNVMALARQVAALEADITNRKGPVITAGNSPQALEVQRELTSLRAQMQMVEGDIQKLDAEVANTPERQEEMDSLIQREAVLRDSYLDSQRKVQEAKLAESLEKSQRGIQVVQLEKAVPPGGPIIPRWQIFLGGLAAVLGVAMCVGILFELLDPVILSAGELEDDTGMPPLGVLPRVA
jgi:succinoglycan biosynthesis transport protein ExoP